jgi:hypothetical protein
VVANDYTVSFRTQVMQILPPARPGLRGGSVRVEAYAGGELKLRFKDRYLAWSPAARTSSSSSSRPPAPVPHRSRGEGRERADNPTSQK